jgi:hypothetical protein
VALDVRRGRLEIVPPDGPSWSTGFLRCRLTQADLVTLLLGTYASEGWLEERGLPEEARVRLAALFPPGGGVFWLTDNF